MPSQPKRFRARRRRTKPSPSRAQLSQRRKPSLLILECDPSTLAAQSSTVADDLEKIVKVLVPHAETVRVSGQSQQELLLQFARCKRERGSFDVVAVVGHSNVSGIRLASDADVSWQAFAGWLKLFSPWAVVLVACEAGRWLPAKALFDDIPTLNQLYGSPVLITDWQAAGVKILVPYLVIGRRLRIGELRVAQIVNFLITRGVLLRHTRKDFRRTGLIDGALWTGGEEILKLLLQQLETIMR